MAEVHIVEEILRRWDPIGVKLGVDGPLDEYDSYAPHVVSMVKTGATTESLAAHLEHLASVLSAWAQAPLQLSLTVAKLHQKSLTYYEVH